MDVLGDSLLARRQNVTDEMRKVEDDNHVGNKPLQVANNMNDIIDEIWTVRQLHSQRTKLDALCAQADQYPELASLASAVRALLSDVPATSVDTVEESVLRFTTALEAIVGPLDPRLRIWLLGRSRLFLGANSVHWNESLEDIRKGLQKLRDQITDKEPDIDQDKLSQINTLLLLLYRVHHVRKEAGKMLS